MHIHDFETFGLGSLFSQMPKSTDNTLRKAAGLVDALYTSDEEKLDRQAALARIISRGDALQTQLNTIEGSHRSLLVSGWRPFIGMALAWHFLILHVVEFILLSLGVAPVGLPQFDLAQMDTILFGMLGLGTLRTQKKQPEGHEESYKEGKYHIKILLVIHKLLKRLN